MSWFLRAVERVVKEELEVGELQLEPYFVDFLQEAPEPTGEEPEDADMEAPKVYEQVYQSVCLSVCHSLSVNLGLLPCQFACQFAHLSVCLSVCLSIFPSWRARLL